MIHEKRGPRGGQQRPPMAQTAWWLLQWYQ